MNNKKSNREAMKYFGMATQVGLNIIVSFGIWIVIAMYVQDWLNLGNWIIIVGILFGLVSAGYSITSFFQMAIRDAKKGEEEYRQYLNGKDKDKQE